MSLLPLRLSPGADLRRALEKAAAAQRYTSAFVVSGIGSLSVAQIRYANQPVDTRIDGPLEIVSLAGTLSPAGAHLHISVSDAQGRVFGGHTGYGNTVRTTAEVLLTLLEDWELSREPDLTTGFNELVVRPKQ